MTVHQLAVGGEVLEKASSTCVCFLKLNKSNSSLEDIVLFSLGGGGGGGNCKASEPDTRRSQQKGESFYYKWIKRTNRNKHPHIFLFLVKCIS